MADFDIPTDITFGIEPFDLDKEYVADPLIPDATLRGIISKVELKPDSGTIEFTVQLQGNDGVYCTDGITPVDGKTSRYTLWLPVKGDELVKSQFSALTRRQDKIRSIKKFSEKMGINLGTEKEMRTSIDNHSWLSIPVLATIKSRPYEGVLYNQVKKMERLTS